MIELHGMTALLRLSAIALVLLGSLWLRRSHAAEVRVASREELVRALQAAGPGTTIRIAPGDYRGGISQAGLHGLRDAPIVIAAEDAKSPPVIEGGSFGFQFSSPEHLELRDLTILAARDNGLNIDDSGSVDMAARNIKLRGLVVREIGPDGNCDGIKLSGVDGFRIEDCRFEAWGGSGSAIDMVGCRQGVVIGCRFANARSANATGVQTKGGSSDIAIQRCRFEQAGGRAVNAGGSTGLAYFRPRDATYEAKDITVEDCEFLGGEAAIAFVGVDGAIVRHNTIYRPRRWAVRILQENTDPRFVACRNGQFRKNVVVFRADEMRQAVNVGPDTQPESFVFADNAWHCLDRPGDTPRLVRTLTPKIDDGWLGDPGLSAPEEGDLSIAKREPDDPGVRNPRAQSPR